MHRTLLAALVAALITSCATQPKAAQTKTEVPKAQDDTVNYTPLGSWVPKKVKKAQLATTEQQQEQTRDALRNLTTTAPGYKGGTER
ncbi:MAG TPA: hypothetical protein VK477_13145 [Acidobacteriota bacterium]|nr:hypothetical protein [Acidobacteriota bacterium]